METRIHELLHNASRRNGIRVTVARNPENGPALDRMQISGWVCVNSLSASGAVVHVTLTPAGREELRRRGEPDCA